MRLTPIAKATDMIQYQVSGKPRKWEKDHQSSLEQLQKKRTAAALNFSLHFLQREIYAITLKNHICLKVSVCNSFVHLVSICRIYWHPDPSIWTVTYLFVWQTSQFQIKMKALSKLMGCLIPGKSQLETL